MAHEHRRDGVFEDDDPAGRAMLLPRLAALAGAVTRRQAGVTGWVGGLWVACMAATSFRWRGVW
jgi:hypothetical protein